MCLLSGADNKWKNAMDAQINDNKSLLKKDVSDLIPKSNVPPDCNIIGTRWALQIESHVTPELRF